MIERLSSPYQVLLMSIEVVDESNKIGNSIFVTGLLLGPTS